MSLHIEPTGRRNQSECLAPSLKEGQIVSINWGIGMGGAAARTKSCRFLISIINLRYVSIACTSLKDLLMPGPSEDNEKNRDEILKRMLKTPHKPHDPNKAKAAKKKPAVKRASQNVKG